MINLLGGKHPLEVMIAAKFPNVRNFRIDWHMPNVEPIRYEDASGSDRVEHPPVARWSVGDRHFVYVAEPEFIVEEIGSWPLKRKVTRVDYSAQQSAVISEIEKSCSDAGKAKGWVE